MQWVTFVAGGRFASGEPWAIVPAAALLVLFATLAIEHLRRARASRSRGASCRSSTSRCRRCARRARCSTPAFTWSRSTLHYTEYHVIMAPRIFRGAASPDRAVDRVALWLRSAAMALFYALLATVVILFELRNQVPKGQAASTAFLVHIFDGIFLVHYFIEAFLWKFGNPYYRATLAPLYFGGGAAGRHRAKEPPALDAGVRIRGAASARGRGAGGKDGCRRSRSGSASRVLLSGAAALAFETLWFRQAGLAFGKSVWASSLVLSAFMAGMAVGNLVCARYGDRVRRRSAPMPRLEV